MILKRSALLSERHAKVGFGGSPVVAFIEPPLPINPTQPSAS